MNDVQKIIEILKLKPHPEGGLFAESFVDTNNFDRGRKLSSVIYYLLKYDEYSHWHKVDATECWFWHCGAPLALTVSENGHDAHSVNLGADIINGQKPHFVVQKHWWQTAETLGPWTLVSCMVTPAFSFDGFELAAKDWRPTPR